MEFVIAILIVISTVAGVFAIIYSIQGNRLIIMERLKTYTTDPKVSYLPPELTTPLRERAKNWAFPFFDRVSNRLIPANKKLQYEKKLLTAGNPLGITAETYLVGKYCLPIIAAIMGMAIGSIWAALIFFVIGSIVPDLWLKANEDRRKEMILRNLPDILDLLSVSVEAGLSFDGAMQKVIEKSHGPLSVELDKTMAEVEIGKPRREALRDLGERVQVDDVSLFIGSILQAEQLGVPMSNVLKLQAKQVRDNRKMRAEEKAQKAPVKILIPMIVFIFPTIMIVLMGPAALKLMDTL